MARSLEQQLEIFLSDMYSVELQALAQLQDAPAVAGAPAIAESFREHCRETREQARVVGERLKAAGGSRSVVKEIIMKLGGKAFLIFARAQPETPGKLLVHSYSYEAMEWAGYEVLKRLADRAGDVETMKAAQKIGSEERRMMTRIEQLFDAAEQASHGDTPADELPDHILTHLAEAHALSAQNAKLLQRSESIAKAGEVERIYMVNLAETKQHLKILEQCLEARGGSRSLLEDIALKTGGLNWSYFFRAQADTPAKLAAFAYAVEHLLIGGSEMLLRTARRAGDEQLVETCQRLIREQRIMADRVEAGFEVAVQSTLKAVA